MTTINPYRVACRFILCCLLILPCLAAKAETEGTREERLADSLQWSESIRQWEQIFEQTDSYLKQNTLTEETSDRFYGQLNKVRAEALRLKSAVDEQQKAVKNLLMALGPKPAEGEAPESSVIASKRTEYEKQLAIYREQLAQIDLAIVRSGELSDGLSSLRHGVLIKEISTRFPYPVDPVIVFSAVNESVAHVKSLLLAPHDWFESLSREDKEKLDIWPTLLVTVCSLLLGLFMRSWIIHRYGRDPQNETPSQTLKLSAAIAEGIGRGVVPVLVLLGVVLWISQHASVPEGIFADMLRSGFSASIFFVVLSTLVNAVLSPAQPNWRLVDISLTSTRVIGSAAFLLLAVVAFDRFITGSTSSIELNEAVQSVYIGVMTTLKALFIMVISIGRWWESPEPENQEDNQDGVATSYIDYARRFVVIFCLSSVTMALLGYSNLSGYLIDNLIYSALIVFFFYGLRAIVLEIFVAISKSHAIRSHLGMRTQTLQQIRIWVSGLVSATGFVFAAASIAIVWGVATEDMYRWMIYLFTGFTVGSITISVTEILIAVLVFAGVMVVTRLIQRTLLNSVLPQFTSNRSMQHSLSSGAGYIGILVAIMMFIAALGIKLESIALVAGALSVGIGFGLQNIVNNFVSGLILILERPIKVGDWVSVNGNEGFVQQINFRATELETFTRATVIIPNSDMLSNSLTNMTYHDKTSRVEVMVQVAYGSDPDLVIRILKDAATQQASVLRYPEVFVLLTDFGADGLNFELRCYVRDAETKIIVASDIRLKVLETLTANGIEIPYPQRVIHLGEFSGPSVDKPA